MKLFSPGPRQTSEFHRIAAIPTRGVPADTIGAALAGEMTEMLKAPGGAMALRPLQALALAEANEYGGALCLLPVGQGKTLISYLMPGVLNASRALLIVPGKLRNKTITEFEALKKHWKYTRLEVTSYEMISTHPEFLKRMNPDLIILDEAHKIKSAKSACTKRIVKFWKNNEVNIVAMSGTLASRSFFDWWHIQLMVMRDGQSVLPYDWKEAETWSRALDEKCKDRVGLGALKHFGHNLSEARKGFGTFIKQVPGIIAADSADAPCSLSIEIKVVKHARIDEALKKMEQTWELPNGDEIVDATAYWRHVRELSNGFYYFWKTQPPEVWREARRAFHGFVREKLSGSRKYEAPAQIIEAFRDAKPVVEWMNIRDSFTPETDAEFLTLDYLQNVVDTAKANNSLIWFQDRAVGQQLSAWGLPVYASQGKEVKTKQSITARTKPCPVAVSTNALSEGFNLQLWNHNMVLNCTPTGTAWEQMIGRTHRFGQTADSVDFLLMASSEAQIADFKQARADARYIEATTGQRQKLTIADICGEVEIEV